MAQIGRTNRLFGGVVNKAAGEQDGSLIRQQGYEVALGTRLMPPAAKC